MAMQFPPLTFEQERELLRSEEFDYVKVERFTSWTMYINPNQYHLGRAYLWLNTRHVDFHPREELTDYEEHELKVLMKFHRRVVTHLWRPDLIEAVWVGDGYEKHRGHGHLHLIPRYAMPPKILDFGRPWLVFSDEEFGRNFSVEKERLLESRQLEHIRKEFVRRL